MAARRGLWLSLALVAAVLLAGRGVAQAYADRAEHAALGAAALWRLRTLYQAVLGTAAFVIGGAFAFVNLWFVRRSVVSLVLPRRMGNIEIGEEVPGRALMSLVTTGALILGVLAAFPADDWQALALAVHGAPFGEFEPYFAADAGYFVYRVPFERAVHAWALYATGLTSVAVVLLYAVTPSLRVERGRVVVTTYVRRHLAVLTAVILALVAWRCRLDAFALVLEGHGADGAFAAVDRAVLLPASILLMIAAIAAAILVLWSGWVGQRVVALAAIGTVLLAIPGVRLGAPALARARALEPVGAAREQPYLATRAEFTRRGFGVDRLPSADAELPPDPAAAAARLPVWEAGAVRATLERGPGVPVGEVALTRAGGRLAWLAIARPTSDATARPERWRTVRVLAADADGNGGALRVDARGLLPPDDPPTAAAVVYPGARGYAVLPAGAEVVAAPPLGGWLSRFAFAWSEQNVRLLAATDDPAVLVTQRDVHARLATVAPFLVAARAVHPVVHGDTLWWAVELYAVTREFPLARPVPFADVPDARYVRHAATALIDAHRGSVRLVAGGRPDPITATWTALLPGLLFPIDSLAPGVAAQLPPLDDLALVRARAFGAVGASADAPARRFVPPFDGADSALVARAPTPIAWGDGTATVWPLVDGADRVQGAMIATGGARRTVAWLRAAGPTARWNGVLERLRRALDTAVAGSAEPVMRGALRLAPSANGSAWMVTAYAWPGDGVVRVLGTAVARGDSVVVTRGAAQGAPPPDPATPEAVRARVRALAAEMRAALRRGDWAGFGRAFEELERLGGRP
jgi:hypothetical protein